AVRAPVQWEVGRPFVDVDVSCTTDLPGGCTYIKVYSFGCDPPLETAGSLLKGRVRVCASSGLYLEGGDGRAIARRILSDVVLEPDPALQEYAAVQGLIFDVNGDRVLHGSIHPYDATLDTLAIWHLSTAVDEPIPAPAGRRLYFGFTSGPRLTPRGALVLSTDQAYGRKIHEWRDGALVELGASHEFFGGFFVNGGFAAWQTYPDGVMHLRDLTAGTTVDLAVAGATAGDAGPNGDFVFTALRPGTTYDFDVYRYRAGAITALTSDPAYSYDQPRTDGINVVYARYPIAHGYPGQVAMFRDGVETLLAAESRIACYDCTSYTDYRLTNGWIAFTAVDFGVQRIRLRSPGGVVSEIPSISGHDAEPIQLAPDGDVAYMEFDSTYAGLLYLARAGQTPRRIGRAASPHYAFNLYIGAGRAIPYYAGGRWLVAAGRKLFTLTSDPCSYAVAPQDRSFGASGGTATFEVVPSRGACAWSVAGVPSWIRLDSARDSAGTDVVRLGIGRNDGGQRSAALTIAGHAVFIRQAAAGQQPRVSGDFTGDGLVDLGVYRPDGGMWIIQGLLPTALGNANSVPVPGDYDGDGLRDLAVFMPESGTWSVRNLDTFSWGQPGDIPVPGDYDGDGRTDAAVFRPALGRWFVRQQFVTDWGMPGDLPVPADYDGDGRTDVAIFRPASGAWYIRGMAPVSWGRPGDIPVPADYDGDGRIDIAVYRPSNGVWYVRGQFTAAYGLPGDLPVPADVDSDGRADLVVFRRSSGTWFVKDVGPAFTLGGRGDLPLGLAAHLVPAAARDLNGDRQSDAALFNDHVVQWSLQESPGSFAVHVNASFGNAAHLRRVADIDGDGRADLVVVDPVSFLWSVTTAASGYREYASFGQWGVAGDVPLPGDYDGDGRADLMVFRPSTGRWYLRTSASGYTDNITVDWGAPGDVPVPADYDGDRKIDLAVFRPSAGRWLIKRSSDGGTTVVDWGISSDIVAPADYDGDGRTDVAVFRPSTGAWWILHSSSDYSTYAAVAYGLDGDVPMPGDYDGDGLAEPAYFRAGSGLFTQSLGLIHRPAEGLTPVVDR
ncbi:MAG: FG-GAP-like repeat-containing protein, partial [Acidobacteriota bacterium]